MDQTIRTERREMYLFPAEDAMLLYWVHVGSLCCNCTCPVGGTIVHTVGLLWKIMTVRFW